LIGLHEAQEQEPPDSPTKKPVHPYWESAAFPNTDGPVLQA